MSGSTESIGVGAQGLARPDRAPWFTATGSCAAPKFPGPWCPGCVGLAAPALALGFSASSGGGAAAGAFPRGARCSEAVFGGTAGTPAWDSPCGRAWWPGTRRGTGSGFVSRKGVPRGSGWRSGGADSPAPGSMRGCSRWAKALAAKNSGGTGGGGLLAVGGDVLQRRLVGARGGLAAPRPVAAGGVRSPAGEGCTPIWGPGPGCAGGGCGRELGPLPGVVGGGGGERRVGETVPLQLRVQPAAAQWSRRGVAR